MSKILGAIKGLFSDEDGKGIISQVNDVVDTYVTTSEDKHNMKMEIKDAMHQKELELRELSLQAKEEFNQRIKDLEGTASDLKQAGFPGKVVLFIRGAQRPLWGFALMYADYAYFSGNWQIENNSQQGDILWLINILVLTFLFGERAIKNAAPYIDKIKNKR